MQIDFLWSPKWPKMASRKPLKKHQIGNFGPFLTLWIGILITILFSIWQQSSYIPALFTEMKNPPVSWILPFWPVRGVTLMLGHKAVVLTISRLLLGQFWKFWASAVSKTELGIERSTLNCLSRAVFDSRNWPANMVREGSSLPESDKGIWSSNLVVII
jgi:hypothetical protein